MKTIIPAFFQVRYLWTVLLTISMMMSLEAQTYRLSGLGNDWNDPNTWTCQGGGCKATPGDKLNGGVKIFIDDSVYYSGSDLQLINAQLAIEAGGTLFVDGTDILVENNKNKGSLFINDGALKVIGGIMENRGIVEFSNAYVQVENAFTNQNTIALDSACIKVTSGNFINDGGTLNGIIGSIWVENGDIYSTGTWTSGISYCVSGSVTGTISGSADCQIVQETCNCLEVPCAIPNPDILPGINSVLRSDSIIGAELTALARGLTEDDLKDDVFVLGTAGDVCIDIFTIDYAAVETLLSSTYGVTNSDFQPGSNQVVITVFFPITDLTALNRRSDIIRFVRPTPVGRTNSNSSLDNQGDLAQESFFTRAGFGLTGAGIKVGVISDSYNRSPDNQDASVDVAGGVLPGDSTIGSTNATPVNVLLDYPGFAIDEGRGMAQIVHSVAPQAELAFHTAFISPHSFADGIRALRDSACDVIVDDITYITESFFGNGIVSQAVSEVVSDSVLYLTSAGNFADRSYEANFTTVESNKHDFSGSGDWRQELLLEPGQYLLVLQWADQIYSANNLGGGAQIDLDFYLADNSGLPIYGFNRDNIGGDPVEVMPFTVISAGPTTTNLFIEQVSGPSAEGIPIKYVVFKAGGANNSGFSGEYYSGGSTVVGHANNLDAMSVGAVRYLNSPTYGGALTTESFSSSGDGISKPDFTSPDGGNVTVNLGNDFAADADNLANFLGTSAAAPHAAGVAALLLESRSKFSVNFNVRNKITSTAIVYPEPTSRRGAGFISAFDAVSSFSNPSPNILKLDTLLGIDPTVGGELVIEGEYFVDGTTVYFRDTVLTPISSTDTSITVIIPPYDGNPPIWVENQALANGDGGVDTAYLDDPVITPVTILAESTTKKYGEAIPELSFTTDNPELNGNPTLMGFLSDAISLSTVAEDTSSVGQYAVIAVLDQSLLNVALNELYEFSIGAFGSIKIEPVEITIKPNPITAVYGNAIPGITYQYLFPDTLAIPNKTLLQNAMAADHEASVSNVIAVVKNISLANISLANRAFIGSFRNISLANISLANGMNIIEVDGEHLNQTETSNLERGTDLIGNISLANFISLANSQAYANTLDTDGMPSPPELNISLANFISLANISLANDYQELVDANISLANISLANFISLANISLANFISLANISLANFISLANGTSVIDFDPVMRNFISLANNDNSGVVAILDSADIYAPDTLAIPLVPINLITGLEVGQHQIVPAAMFSNTYSPNVMVNYDTASLIITPATLTATADDTSRIYGAEDPEFSISYTGFVYDDGPMDIDELPVATSDASCDSNVGLYNIDVTGGIDSNYIIDGQPGGTLTIEKAPITIIADDQVVLATSSEPVYTFTGVATVCGLHYEETISDPGLIGGMLDMPFGTAGIYTITPIVTGYDPLNFYVDEEVVPGTLYVNPVVGCNDKIQASDICKLVVDTTIGTVTYNTLLRFEYTNNTAYPFYIPFSGTSNGANRYKVKGSSIQYIGDAPTLFEVGTGYFDVLTTGEDLQWEITTPGCNNFSKSPNGSNADPCGVLLDHPVDNTITRSYEVTAYPNPFRNEFTLELDREWSSVNGKVEIITTDIIGRKIVMQTVEEAQYLRYTIDLTGQPAGIYFVNVYNGTENRILKILKE